MMKSIDIREVLQALAFKVVLWSLHHLGVPEIVCLCGSTRFYNEFQAANLRETLAGRIVLSVGCDTKADTDLFGALNEEASAIKCRLDVLHKRKIDMSDEVLGK